MDDNEIHSLKEEIIDLRSKLDHAASAGLALLQTNEDMNKQHEKDVQSYNEQLEQLKQENFTLSNKLSHQTSTHQAFLDELEHVKTETEGKYEQKIKTMEQSYQMKLQDMKYRFEEIERELNSCINNEKLLKEKVTTQEGTIASLREQIVTDGNWNNNDEVDEMRRLCTTLECSNEELKSKVSDLTSQLGTSSDAVRSLENKVNELEESLCDRVKLSNEWYSNLMEVQDLNKVLQNQLDVFKLGQLEEDWQNSGNSLFGEVEERRLDTERKYISLQVKHDALEKRYQALQQQYKQLKTQVSALMCRLGTTNADAAQIERLQRSLYLKDNQIQSLTNKVHKLEREKNKASPVNSLKKADQFEDEKGYTLYLKKQIEGQEKKISEISQELELKRTEFVWESIKLNDTEAKLHKCEQDKARLINDATKMRLKLNDNKEKENELQVQLDMRDKEISVLKEQLKVKIKKGKCTIDIKEDDDKELKEAQSVIGPAATVKPHSAAPKPLNLLEELQKHIETTESANTSVMKARVPLVNEENHNPNTNESPINGQQPAAGNNTPPPIATATTNRPVKILKAKDCPNQCPQQ